MGIEPTDDAGRPDYTFTKPEGLLAHYTTSSAVFEHIVPTRTLRLSPYRLMRDPVENKVITPNIYWDGVDVDREMDELDALLKAARDRMRVMSFTHDADQHAHESVFDCCWSRPRMWEQYGDVHRGACLLFDRSLLEAAIADAWPPETTYLRNVDYSPEGIVGSPARGLIDRRTFLGEGETLTNAVAEYVAQRRDAFFFLKSDDFATEYEYRIVLAVEDDDYAYIEFRDALVGVVLGERFPVWQRPAAIAACSEIDVKLGRMHWEHGRPHVLRVWPQMRL